MRTIRQVNIKNRQNYFVNDMTNIGDLDLSLLNIGQIAFKSNDSKQLFMRLNTLKI